MQDTRSLLYWIFTILIVWLLWPLIKWLIIIVIVAALAIFILARLKRKDEPEHIERYDARKPKDSDVIDVDFKIKDDENDTSNDR